MSMLFLIEHNEVTTALMRDASHPWILFRMKDNDTKAGIVGRYTTRAGAKIAARRRMRADRDPRKLAWRAPSATMNRDEPVWIAPGSGFYNDD